MTNVAPSPRSLPSVGDIERVIVGLSTFMFVFFRKAPPPPGHDSVPYLLAGSMIVVTFGILLGLPAYVFRGRRGDWQGFTRFCGNGLLILGGMSLVGLLLRSPNREPALLESLRAGRVTIDAFVRAEHASAPRIFEMRVLDQLSGAMKRGGIEVSGLRMIDIREGGAWLGAKATYQMTVGPSRPKNTLRHVIYYHAGGMGVVTGACGSPDCARLDALLDTAERNLQQRLAANDLESVLPDGGTCETQSIPLPDAGISKSVICEYRDGMRLGFSRVAASLTIASLAGQGRD